MKRKFLSSVLTVILAGSLAAQPITAMAGDMDFISSEEVVVSEADTVATEEAFSDAPEPTDTESAENEEDFTDSIVIEEEPVEESPEENSQDIFVENDLEAAADVSVDAAEETEANELELTEPIEFTDGIEAASEAEVEDEEAPAAGISFSSATTVSFGTPYSGSLTSSVKSRLYRFTINSSGRVTLSSTAAIYYVGCSLYDSSGERLWSYGYNANSSGQSSISKYFDLTKGTYYLGWDSYTTGNYSFKLTFTSAGESFTESGSGNNNTIAAATQKTGISFGTTYKGQLAINDTKDFYKFSIGSSGSVALSSTAAISYVDYSLYDSSGKELWSSYCSSNASGQCSVSELLDLTKGTYYIGLNSYSSYNTGTYSFKLTFTSAGESFAEYGSGTNNIIAAANTISLEKTYKGQLAINDDKDFYKFSVSSSGKYTLSSTAAISYVTYSLYDSNGRELWSGYYSSDASGQSSISKHLDLTKGTYYLGLITGSSYRTGNYSFKIAKHAHSFKTTVTKATTSRNGTIKKVCSCGYETKSTIYRPSKMSLSTSKYTYNNKVKKPSVTVKASNGATISSSNYSVSYAGNRKNVGRYTVKVTFKGNYSGSMQTSFVINPKSTSIKKLTGSSRSIKVYWKKQSTQTSGYEVQYALNKKFTSGRKTYKISGNRKTSAVYKKLKGNKRYYVRVRTYKVVSGVRYYSAWSSAKSVKTKR